MNGCESLLINKYASDSLGHICCLGMRIPSLALFSVTKLVVREKCGSKSVYCVNAGWKSRSFFFEACLAIFRDFSSGFTIFNSKRKEDDFASTFLLKPSLPPQFLFIIKLFKVYFLCCILLYLFAYVATFDFVWVSFGCFHTTSSPNDLVLLPTQNSFTVTGKCIRLGAFAFSNSHRIWFAFFLPPVLISFALLRAGVLLFAVS